MGPRSSLYLCFDALELMMVSVAGPGEFGNMRLRWQGLVVGSYSPGRETCATGRRIVTGASGKKPESYWWVGFG